jgi:hypothetical protein
MLGGGIFLHQVETFAIVCRRHYVLHLRWSYIFTERRGLLLLRLVVTTDVSHPWGWLYLGDHWLLHHSLAVIISRRRLTVELTELICTHEKVRLNHHLRLYLIVWAVSFHLGDLLVRRRSAHVSEAAPPTIIVSRFLMDYWGSVILRWILLALYQRIQVFENIN